MSDETNYSVQKNLNVRIVDGKRVLACEQYNICREHEVAYKCSHCPLCAENREIHDDFVPSVVQEDNAYYQLVNCTTAGHEQIKLVKKIGVCPVCHWFTRHEPDPSPMTEEEVEAIEGINDDSPYSIYDDPKYPEYLADLILRDDEYLSATAPDPEPQEEVEDDDSSA